MRYTDIKPLICTCCYPHLSEDAATHNLQFNRQTFYNNMRLLIQSGITSDLEGVDTLVRLGYLEKMDSADIFRNFRLEHPIAGARNRGSFNSTEDRVRMAYDLLFEPNSIADGTSTLAHELRHRAFYIISVTPDLAAVMPEDLRSRWADGYGTHQSGVDRWRYEGAFASPEHAMIYAVQYRDPLSSESRSRFFRNPALQGRSVSYWRDLYRAVELAVRGWFQDRVPALTADTAAENMDSPLVMSASQRAFYSSLSSIHGLQRERLAMLLQEMHGRFLAVAFNSTGSVKETAAATATALFDQNYEAMPELIANYQRLAPSITNNRDAVRIQVLLGEFDSWNIPWRLMDMDTFDPAEFAALVRLRPDLVPSVPVARRSVQPSTATTGSSTSVTGTPPRSVVVPTGNRIGLYQWAVSNNLGGTNLWDLITGSVSTNTLRSNMQGMFAVQIETAGLKFTAEAEAQLSALYTMLDAGGYDREVVVQMLARMELIKR